MEPSSDAITVAHYPEQDPYFRIYQERRPLSQNRNEPHRCHSQGSLIYDHSATRNSGFQEQGRFNGTFPYPHAGHCYCGNCNSLRSHSFASLQTPYVSGYSTPTAYHDRRLTAHSSSTLVPESRKYTGSAPNTSSNYTPHRWTPLAYPGEISSNSTIVPGDTSRESTDDSAKSITMDPSAKQNMATMTEKREEHTSNPTTPVSPTPPQKPPQLPQQQHPTWSRIHDYTFIFTVCLAQFLSLSTLAQTVAPLLIIGDDLNTENPGQLAWFTASYSMTLGTFILPAGRLGDIFGHKRIFILGWLWFTMTSFLAGLAHNWGPIGFSIVRGFQGIGPALLVPNAMALVGRTYPIGDKRAFVLSLFGACGPTGFLTGAIFSSIFAQEAHWSWSFWSTAMLTTFATFLAYCVVPDSLATGAPGLSLKHFDFLGCVTGVSGLLLINFALNQAPMVGWSTQYVYFILIIGVILTCAFIYVELHMTKNPLVPIRGLQPQAVLTLACIAAGWASHGIWIYYLFMFQMRIRGGSPLLASAELIPVGPIGVAFALSTVFLIKRIGVARVMLLSMGFFLVGTIFLAIAPANQTYWAMTFLSVLVMPGGMNLSFPAGTILLSNSMPREHQGKAASMISTIVNYSIASGLGFAGTVERYVDTDGEHLLDGYRGAWYLGTGFAALGLMISIYFVWSLRPRKPSS